ncbi:hypothetical protein [Abyssisolibacter fermentans]|uniref:hypothetical protein n=1 Tax=Abyssisolibacter fermentans TaxID=1766203 RepID=UPI000834740B|nr:hypothetical protein [Abyssisolibacter fermentans]
MKKCLIIFLAMMMIFTGCNSVDVSSEKESKGDLIFTANGEDFTRKGFTTLDGWNLKFDNIFISLEDVKAYICNKPYDAENNTKIEADEVAVLNKNIIVDLAAGDENAAPINLGIVKGVSTGIYNAISWKVVNSDDEKMNGSSIVFIGKAEKDGKIIDFTIRFNKQYEFFGGEFVGENRKGIVEEGKTADVEMTYHFDHIFGDGSLATDDELNKGAIGFGPFAKLVVNNEINVDMDKIKNGFAKDDYEKLLNLIPTLGHVGEGHCYSVQIK